MPGFLKKDRKLVIAVAGTLILLFGAVLFVLLTKNSSTLKVIKNLQLKRAPLGKDALSILTASEKLQKSSNYHVAYNVSVSDTLEATKPARFRRVERKKGNNIRIDTYLSGLIPATSYFENAQGKFLCSFVQEETPQCYDLTQKSKAEKNYSDREILANWLKNGAVKTKIGSQTFKAAGDERACDQLETTLIGKDITSDLLGDITKLIPDKPTEEDSAKSRQILDGLAIKSLNCYDRETGLPLKTVRTTTYGQQEQVSAQTADFLSAEPKYIEKLAAKKIITSTSTAFRLFQKIVADGDTIYMAGERGLYMLKDGKLLKHDQEINRSAGDIYALILFQGKMYMGASRGLYSLNDGKWKQDIDMLKTWSGNDFIEFKNTLYAATGNGVFVLEKNSWIQPNSTFKDMGRALELAVSKGSLYTVTDKGLYRYNQGRWSELYKDSEFGKRKIFADKDYLLVGSPSAVLEEKDGKPNLIANWKTTGDVFDAISYGNNIFIAGQKGIFATDKKYILDAEKIGYGRDFFVFQDRLYAGTDGGVYRLEEFGWSQFSNEDVGEIDAFIDKDGVLYAGGLLGTYRFDGSSWISVPVTDVNSFYSLGGRLYVISNNKTFLNEITEVNGDPEEIFNLPVKAKIIKL